MDVDLLVTDAKIYTDEGILDGGLAIDEGVIYKVAKEANLPKASSKIDAEGNIVLPGLIDAHVHLRDLNLSYKEDFYTGTCAAAAGGFTTVLDMPNTVPPTLNASLLRERMDLAAKKVIVNVGLYSCFPTTFEEFKSIANLGAVGFKVYLHRPLTKLDVQDDQILTMALNFAADVKMPVVIHAEDRSMIESVESALKKSGKHSLKDYLTVHTPEVELRAVTRVLALSTNIPVQLHFAHITSLSPLKLICQARKEGKKVTCEITPHNLLLTHEDLLSFGGICLTDPPLRDSHTVDKIWGCLKSGLIDIIASDHAPHPLKDKLVRNVWDIPTGIPGLETTLPLLLNEVNNGRLTISEIVRYLSETPSRIFHLNSKGCINKGLDADLTIIDLTKSFVINSDLFHSKAKYSPFNGRVVKGKAVKTIVAGKLIMDNGEIVAAPGSGTVLKINKNG